PTPFHFGHAGSSPTILSSGRTRRANASIIVNSTAMLGIIISPCPSKVPDKCRITAKWPQSPETHVPRSWYRHMHMNDLKLCNLHQSLCDRRAMLIDRMFDTSDK
ncbi:hypothetical protein THAOC_27768, partial [Thalassiosira oceanica]